MRRRDIPSAFSVLVTACLLACGSDTTQPPPGPQPFFPADYASSYVLVRDCRFSLEHDSHEIVVHADPVSAPAYTNGTYPFAAGTVLVKTLYDDPACSQLAGYVAMRKGPPGTAPASGDWEWQRLDAGRRVLETGQIASCISCHSGCTQGRDFACTDP